MPTVEFVEIAADSVDRAKEFYSKVFGWTFEDMPGPMEYLVARTVGVQGEPGVMIGMMARQHPMQRITAYVGVEDLDATAARITEHGGQVMMGKTPVPNMGWFAVCTDSEDNGFALWQNDPNAG
jgi:hypothetical protein